MPSAVPRLSTFALLACLSLAPTWTGCGWKTGLQAGPPEDDGGTPPDGGLPQLQVECGRRVQYSSPRRPITLVADVEGSVGVQSEGWALTARPGASAADPTPSSGPVTTLVPDVVGTFELRYAITDDAGRTATCEVTVESIVGPPVALCPEELVRVRPDESVIIDGDGYDDELVVAYAWTLLASPAGSSVVLAPTDTPDTQFQGSLPGEYLLELTVYDEDGASGSCEAPVRVVEPPMVTCPPSVVSAPTRRRTDLSAVATDDTGIASTRWEVITRPMGSRPTLIPVNRPTTAFTPDLQGTYVVRFTAVDEDGLEASCTVEVEGTPTPPTAICPARVETRPLVETDVRGRGVDDTLDPLDFAWVLVSRPVGSNASPPSPMTEAVTTLLPDIAGEYVLRLTVTDVDGMQDQCTTTVAALAIEGLRVELFWDSAPDMDLHLLHPDASRWNGPLDCFYANCNTSQGLELDWFGPGTADNPHLDIDDVSSFGPENINIDSPEPGTYRVGVHAYYGTSASVSVRIYCGGSTTMPRASFGPIRLPSGWLWRVADVTITTDDCSLSSLELPGGTPNVESFDGASEPR